MSNPDRKEELSAKIGTLVAELRAIEAAEENAFASKLIGRTFKSHNSYSCPTEPSDYWWLYGIVMGNDGGAVSMVFNRSLINVLAWAFEKQQLRTPKSPMMTEDAVRAASKSLKEAGIKFHPDGSVSGLVHVKDTTLDAIDGLLAYDGLVLGHARLREIREALAMLRAERDAARKVILIGRQMAGLPDDPVSMRLAWKTLDDDARFGVYMKAVRATSAMHDTVHEVVRRAVEQETRDHAERDAAFAERDAARADRYIWQTRANEAEPEAYRLRSVERLLQSEIVTLRSQVEAHSTTIEKLTADDAMMTAVRAQIDGLVAENSRLREMIPRCTRGPKACDAEIDRLTKEHDEVRAAATTLAEFVRTAPGRLPSRVGDALMIIDPTGRRE